jgi:hypothetical protein
MKRGRRRLLGRVSAARAAAPGDAAFAHISRAMTLTEELGMRPLVAHCHLDLGHLHRRTGEGPAVSEHLTTAIAMYREMDVRFWPEQVAPPFA